jgi:hypothetical protein
MDVKVIDNVVVKIIDPNVSNPKIPSNDLFALILDTATMAIIWIFNSTR